MNRNTAYLAAAVVALFWGADARAVNDSDESIAGERPLLRIPLAGRQPNSFAKLVTHLPLTEIEFTGHQPNSFRRIAEEVKYPDYKSVVGHEPNSFSKISAHLPERLDTEDVARYGISPDIKLSGHVPNSFLKISSQYPSAKSD